MAGEGLSFGRPDAGGKDRLSTDGWARHGRRRSGRGVVLGELFRTFGADMLAVAEPVDIDANAVHGEAVEDGHGHGRIAQGTCPSRSCGCWRSAPWTRDHAFDR